MHSLLILQANRVKKIPNLNINDHIGAGVQLISVSGGVQVNFRHRALLCCYPGLFMDQPPSHLLLSLT